jgi:pyrimidine oxygenase
MDIGVFIPIGNNGWLISTTSPQYMPSFDLNREIVQKAERYHLDFALSMIKLRGFGGKSEFWDHNLESFTLMAGLASVTERIRLYASVAVLTLPPAIVARMASTIDSISHGRFGINIVSGWAKTEYEQMGLWPGEAHFAKRYEYSTEYVTVLRELWETGRSDFKGEYFQMTDCRLSPRPQTPIKIVCAGQSDRGMRFGAEFGDYNFTLSTGVNTPTAHAPTNRKMMEAAARTGRDVGNYVLLMVIADETDEAAMAKWRHYVAGLDTEALAWLTGQATADHTATARSNAMHMANPEGAVNLNLGSLIGSYATVARLLDEAAAVPGTQGIMLTFDDFLIGLEQFGRRIQPLMASRRAIADQRPR